MIEVRFRGGDGPGKLWSLDRVLPHNRLDLVIGFLSQNGTRGDAAVAVHVAVESFSLLARRNAMRVVSWLEVMEA